MKNCKFLICVLVIFLLVGCSRNVTTFHYDYNQAIKTVGKIEIFEHYEELDVYRFVAEIEQEEINNFLYDLSTIEFTRKSFSIFHIYEGLYLDGVYIRIYHSDGKIEEINSNYYSGESSVSCSREEFDCLIDKYLE